METRIYIADISPLKNETIFAEYYDRVSVRRKEKVDRMYFQKDKCLSLGAGLLLRQACKDFGIDYQDVTFTENRYSKPFFNKSNIQFNLSHSGERAMCIMSESAVGCDVEQVGRPDLQIAQKYFSGYEYAEILSRADPMEQADCFYRLWTLKESFIKCIGEGLFLSLNEFTVLLDREPARIIQTIDEAAYSLGEYNRGDEYKYSWCLRNTKSGNAILPPPDVRVIDLSHSLCNHPT